MLPFETTDLPEVDEDDIDPFAELQVGSSKPAVNSENALDAFEEEDLLSAFTDDAEDVQEEIVISFEDEDVPPLDDSKPNANNRAEETYKLLLETVWVDDILDPSEVELLARKRVELGLTFERHLQLVRDIIGG